MCSKSVALTENIAFVPEDECRAACSSQFRFAVIISHPNLFLITPCSEREFNGEIRFWQTYWSSWYDFFQSEDCDDVMHHWCNCYDSFQFQNYKFENIWMNCSVWNGSLRGCSISKCKSWNVSGLVKNCKVEHSPSPGFQNQFGRMIELVKYEDDDDKIDVRDFHRKRWLVRISNCCAKCLLNFRLDCRCNIIECALGE